jgi:nitroreductase
MQNLRSLVLDTIQSEPSSSLESELIDATVALIQSRQNVSAKRLVEPGPSQTQVTLMFQAAAAAPDHGEILPWRFVLVAPPQRGLLAEAFAQALLERDPLATQEQLAAAREKAFRAPFLAVAIARLGLSEPDIDPLERMVSLGAAIQNILLCAHAMGFGAGLTSGQAMRSGPLARLLQLADGEHAICCVNVGTVTKRKPMRPKPDVSTFVTAL